MSGFVYIWRDRKRSMFYLGSHWGSQTDGYVCSSKPMLRAYKKRPQDFRRRILAIVTTSRRDLHAEEQRWLDLVRPDELQRRYYNYKKYATGADPVAASLWMRGNKHGLGKPCSPEKREKIAAAQRGKYVPPEVREKMRAAKLGKKQSPETIAKRAAALAGRKRPAEVGWKISAAKMGHRYTTPAIVQKMNEARLRNARERSFDPRQGALL